MTFDELCEEYTKIDSFMEPQITGEIYWWVIESDFGTRYEIAEGRKKNTEMPNGRWWIDFELGFGARLSTPGYMDCTEWCVFSTEQEAIDYLEEMYLEPYRG